MTRLRDIKIHVEPPAHIEPPARRGGLGGGVTALLSEAADLLERLANGGSPAMIDLRSLPMSAQDRAALQGALGEGEVRVTLNADGISTLYETAIAGLWWVEHRNRQGDVIAELLEIARFPLILDSAPDEIATSGLALRALVSAGLAEDALRKDHVTRQ
jgi:hydrogenase-1 operon protein HyaF